MASGVGYRRLAQLGGTTFLVVGLIARLPLAMSQIGTLLLVLDMTGSYGQGGLAAGALAIANAIGAPICAALTDRWGQRWVISGQSLSSGLGMVGLVFASRSGAGFPVCVVIAIVAGFFLPQIGTMARVRWRELDASQIGERGRLLGAAFSWEGAADETSFVLGPALIGILALLGGPGLGLLVAGASVIVFGDWFAHHPTVRLVRPQLGKAALGSVWSLPLVMLICSMLMIGTLFGSIQTGTSVLATAVDAQGATGLLHSLLGVGSVIAGLLLPLLPARYSLIARWRFFTAGLMVCALPLLLVDGLGWLVVILLVLGVFVAPSMITVFSLGERVAPPQRLGTAMTLIAAVTTLGYALGAGVAGRLADGGGHGPAFGVTIAAATTMSLIAWAGSGVVTAGERCEQAQPSQRHR